MLIAVAVVAALVVFVVLMGQGVEMMPVADHVIDFVVD